MFGLVMLSRIGLSYQNNDLLFAFEEIHQFGESLRCIVINRQGDLQIIGHFFDLAQKIQVQFFSRVVYWIVVTTTYVNNRILLPIVWFVVDGQPFEKLLLPFEDGLQG